MPSKDIIKSGLRIEVWKKYNGEQWKGTCYTGCGREISIENHECGHITSRHNGGKVEIDNLRPICTPCNRRMRTTSMVDFIKEYKYESNLLNEKIPVYEEEINISAVKTNSLKSLDYVIKNLNEVPAFVPIDDYSIVRDDTNNQSFEEKIINKDESLNLIEYLSSLFVKLYTKNDKNEQILWIADKAKQNFLIRSSTNDKLEWILDKKATICRRNIVMPFIDFIKKILCNYAKEISKNYSNSNIKLITHIASLKLKLDKESTIDKIIIQIAKNMKMPFE